MSKLKELQGKLEHHLKEARDIAKKAEDEDRDFTDDERTLVADCLEKATPIKEEIKVLRGDDEMRKSLASFGGSIGLVEDDDKDDKKSEPGSLLIPSKSKSIGQMFTDSPEYKALVAQFPDGRFPEKARIQSNPVGFKSLVTGVDSTSGGAFVTADDTGIYDPLGRRPLTIRSIVSARTTLSDTVEFVRQTGRTNNAAPVPEASISGAIPNPDDDNTAGVKPESGFTFQRVQEPVVTLAHWVPATKRSLSDAAQIRGIIDQELRDGLREEEEDQILNGSGTGENLTGILNTNGVQDQDFDTDMFVTIRKAKTKVSTIGRAVPSHIVLNPEDDERLDLMRDGEDRFYGNGPWATGPSAVWALPRVVSEAIPAGTGLVGDFRRAVLWDREQASITVSDSHADFFIRNLVAFLAEQRLAFGVIRPAAFVITDFGSGS